MGSQVARAVFQRERTLLAWMRREKMGVRSNGSETGSSEVLPKCNREQHRSVGIKYYIGSEGAGGNTLALHVLYALQISRTI